MANKLKQGTFVTYKIDGEQYAGYIMGVEDTGEYKVRALYNHDRLLTAYGDIDYVTEITEIPKLIAYSNDKPFEKGQIVAYANESSPMYYIVESVLETELSLRHIYTVDEVGNIKMMDAMEYRSMRKKDVFICHDVAFKIKSKEAEEIKTGPSKEAIEGDFVLVGTGDIKKMGIVTVIYDSELGKTYAVAPIYNVSTGNIFKEYNPRTYTQNQITILHAPQEDKIEYVSTHQVVKVNLHVDGSKVGYYLVIGVLQDKDPQLMLLFTQGKDGAIDVSNYGHVDTRSVGLCELVFNSRYMDAGIISRRYMDVKAIEEIKEEQPVPKLNELMEGKTEPTIKIGSFVLIPYLQKPTVGYVTSIDGQALQVVPMYSKDGTVYNCKSYTLYYTAQVRLLPAAEDPYIGCNEGAIVKEVGVSGVVVSLVVRKSRKNITSIVLYQSLDGVVSFENAGTFMNFEDSDNIFVMHDSITKKPLTVEFKEPVATKWNDPGIKYFRVNFDLYSITDEQLAEIDLCRISKMLSMGNMPMTAATTEASPENKTNIVMHKDVTPQLIDKWLSHTESTHKVVGKEDWVTIDLNNITEEQLEEYGLKRVGKPSMIHQLMRQAGAITRKDMEKYNKPLRYEPKTEPHRIAKGDIVSVKDSNSGVSLYATVISVSYDKEGYVWLVMNVFSVIDEDGVCSPRGYTVNRAYKADEVTVIASMPYFMDKLMQHTPEVVSDTPSNKLVVLPYPIGHKVYYKSDGLGAIYPCEVFRYEVLEKSLIMVLRTTLYAQNFTLIPEVWEQKNRLSDNLADLA